MNKESRFTTVKYDEGASFSVQWCPIMDGEWRYGKDCYEVIFKKRGNSPEYLNPTENSEYGR